MFTRIYFIAKKEMIQLLRDRRTFGMLLIAPVIQLIIFGYVATTEVKQSGLALCDLNRTAESRGFVERFTAGGYFNVTAYVDGVDDINPILDSRQAVVAMIIPRDFDRKLARGDTAAVGIYIDGTNSNLATIVSAYIKQIAGEYSKELVFDYFDRNGITIPEIMTARPRVWFNPELKSVNFMVPGVMAILTLLLLMNLTALAIVREREVGTVEQLAVTPIKALDLVIGKSLPPMFIGYLIITLVLVLGLAWFKISFEGSVLLLYFLSFFFILACLAAGLLISALSQTADQAMWANQVFFIPNVLLSGFIFPISNMPKPIQLITYLLPMRYYLDIIRGIFLRGAGLRQHWNEALILLIWGLVVLSIASLKLKKKLV